MKKIKIAHIEDRFNPLLSQQLNVFAKYHSEKFDFHIVTSDNLDIWQIFDKEKIQQIDKEFEKKYNVKIHRLPAFKAGKNKTLLFIKGLPKYIKNLNPEIIFSHGTESYNTWHLLVKNFAKKYIFYTDTHTLWNQIKTETLKSKLYYAFIKGVISKKINTQNITVFATTEENRRILTDFYKIKKENIGYLPISTDLQNFRYSPEDAAELRKKLNIPPDNFVIFFSGKLDNKKKPHLIAEAVKFFQDKLKEKIYIIFLGFLNEKYEKEILLPAIKNLNEKTEVKILPPVKSTELYKYFSMADISVFPEENTLSALEAQACKCPVIMKDDAVNRERLKYGGLLYEQNNIKDLSDKIFELYENKNKRLQLSQKGYEYIKNNYNYELLIKNMEKLFLEKIIRQ